MTTLIVRCPNAECGRISHLGVDPLGRIFRCPRCLTKLPSASSAAADTAWTAVLGPPRPASSLHDTDWTATLGHPRPGFGGL